MAHGIKQNPKKALQDAVEVQPNQILQYPFRAPPNTFAQSNPRLVAHWLPSALERGNHKAEHSKSTGDEVTRREHLQELFALFIQRLDFRQSGRNVFDWHFKVQRNDPLIVEHEVIKSTAVRLLAAADQEGVLVDLYTFLDWLPNDCFESLLKILKSFKDRTYARGEN